MENKPNELNIELSEEKAEGTYSNLVLISHSPAEFVFDFIRVVPGIPKAKVYSRIIMSPMHAKGFLLAMQENLSNYEKQFGKIQSIGGQGPKPDDRYLFKPTNMN